MKLLQNTTVFLLWMIASISWAGTPAPSALRCELLLGDSLYEIVDPTPNFAWVVPVIELGGRQTSYQIQVSRAKDGFHSVNSLVWDSGSVNSSMSVAVEYAGEELQTKETYEWRVRVGVEHGELGAWSGPQRFTMAAEIRDAPSGHQTVTNIIEPVGVTELESGRLLYDFGEVAFGYLELDLVASTEGELNVHLGERGSETGIVSELFKHSNVRYYSVPLAVSSGNGVYSVHPPKDERNTRPAAIAIPGRFGRIAPFRYVEIERNGIELSKLVVKQVAIHYPWNEYASSFESSDADLNALWELCKYSMKATSFAGVYVDGDRERIPYEADSYINMLSHYAVDSEYSIGRRTHEYLMDFATWPTEWKQHSVMMAGMDFMYTGDNSSIRRIYERLKKEKTLEERAREDGLLVGFPYEEHSDRPGDSADIVDWPPGERDGYVFQEVNTVVNAFHYLNLRQMAEMANALGKADDAADYANRANRFYKTFNEHLFDEETGLYVDGIGTDHSAFHANLFPLAFGLVADEFIESVTDFIVSKDLACSVYAAQYLLEALYQGGREDAALRLMTMKGKRSWQNMLDVGSTITLEAWDDSFKPNQDWNHAWGAAPGNAIARFLLGVRPLEPGFSKMLIAPRPGSLTFAKGRVPTIRGPVDVSIENRNESISAELRIPGNTEPTVSLKLPADKRIGSLAVNGEEYPYSVDSQIVTLEGLTSGEFKIELSLR
ncbi:hypothetical protein MLD52_09410 [Puniceicoccaceae bacterium K14]|nr:hypothetical protein [Puniceicoccaceae bacterium K14]